MTGAASEVTTLRRDTNANIIIIIIIIIIIRLGGHLAKDALVRSFDVCGVP